MANISAQLLAVLRCPVTGSTLVQHGDQLVSTVDGPNGVPCTYGIIDGIPVLLRPSGDAPSDTQE
ncbi:hypothetical protein GCM10023081_16860 [Arthrobacter ginkgonis]|jgi:uncharacterized protein|uniref:Trm112 family protein n=1 Tax=Arthrobacter ginkgonis TaxID=1630594 RepID=A0ABP7C464_9MICC